MQSPILLMSICLAFCFFSCRKEANKATVPAYLQIDEVSVTTTTLEGSSSHNITDVWVGIGDQSLGAYELPAKVPILASGSTPIKIEAGIKENGVAASRAINIFYAPYEFRLDLISGETTVIKPQFSYSSDIVFALIEDFEATANKFTTYNSDVDVVSQTTVIFEGNKSGEVVLTASAPTFNAYLPFVALPTNGSKVYLELDYKCNQQFTIGVYFNGLNHKEVLFGVNASDVWNKIYFDLTDALQYSSNATDANIYFNAVKSGNASTSTIYLDNIKLIHF